MDTSYFPPDHTLDYLDEEIDFTRFIENTPAGGRSRHDILIARLPSGNPVYLSAYIYKGKKKGPIVLISAGLHGDEVNGVEIVRRLMDARSLEVDSGVIIAIPVINIYGFLNFNRDVPDGKDANRSFPGIKSGSLASRVAWNLTKFILPVIDTGVDFHTGGNSRSNYPQIRCNFNDAESRELALAFRPPFIVNSGYIEGSLRFEANKMGKSIIVYEAGMALRFNEFAIEHGIAGTMRLLHHLNMTDSLKAAVRPTDPIYIERTSWIRAEDAGLFNHYVTEGMHVVSGQKLGVIADPNNEYQHIVNSPLSGYVIAVNHCPVVNGGDALIHIGLVEQRI